jgi:tetratricopeptide (TPR) repeat protein
LTAARTILLEARHVNPLNTDHSANLGRLYKNWADLSKTSEQRLERIAQSVGYYEQAATLSPQNTIVWNELATVYLYQLGDLDKAWKTIQHSLELDDRYEQTYMIAGDARLRESEATAQQITAKQQQLQNADDTAKATLEQEIDQLMRTYNEQLLEAIAEYERALELQPNLLNVYRTVSGAYEQLGRLDDAVATLEQAARANPNAEDPYLGLAELYQRQNNIDAAIAAYRQAIAADPNNANTHIMLASLLESQDRLNEALIEIQEAARLNPSDASLRQNLAFTYQRLQMYPEALAEARAAAQLAPNDPTPQLLIGDTSRLMNDLAGAITAYERALAIAPNMENAWNVLLNLALLHQELNQLDLALDYATEALNVAPEGQRQQINDFILQLEQQIAAP